MQLRLTDVSSRYPFSTPKSTQPIIGHESKIFAYTMAILPSSNELFTFADISQHLDEAQRQILQQFDFANDEQFNRVLNALILTANHFDFPTGNAKQAAQSLMKILMVEKSLTEFVDHYVEQLNKPPHKILPHPSYSYPSIRETIRYYLAIEFGISNASDQEIRDAYLATLAEIQSNNAVYTPEEAGFNDFYHLANEPVSSSSKFKYGMIFRFFQKNRGQSEDYNQEAYAELVNRLNNGLVIPTSPQEVQKLLDEHYPGESNKVKLNTLLITKDRRLFNVIKTELKIAESEILNSLLQFTAQLKREFINPSTHLPITNQDIAMSIKMAASNLMRASKGESTWSLQELSNLLGRNSDTGHRKQAFLDEITAVIASKFIPKERIDFTAVIKQLAELERTNTDPSILEQINIARRALDRINTALKENSNIAE